MPKYATLPNGQTAEFPDDTPDEVIERVTGKKISTGAGIEEPAVSAPSKEGWQDDGSYIINGKRLDPTTARMTQGTRPNDETTIAQQTRENLPEIAMLPVAPLVGPASKAVGLASKGSQLGIGALLSGLLAGGGRAAQIGMDKAEGVADPSLGEAARDVAATGANTATMSFGLGKGIDAAAPLVRNLGDKAMKSAMKLDRGFLEKMAGARKQGINAMERQILNTAERYGVNPATRGGEDKIQDTIDATHAKYMGKVAAAPQVPIPGAGANVMRAARGTLSKVGRGDAPQKQVAQVKKLISRMETSPQLSHATKQAVTIQPRPGPPGSGMQVIPGKETRVMSDPTPLRQAEAIEANNRSLSGLYRGGNKDAEIAGRLNVQGARTKDLNRVAGTRKEAKALKNLINLREVSQITRRRAGATNPLSITDFISLSSGHPGIALASAGMKAPVQGAAAQNLWQLNRGMADPGTMQKILRAIAAGGVGNAFSEWRRPDSSDEPEEP